MISPWLEKYYRSINIMESKKVMDHLSRFGDDPATGNRSAGSKASEEAAAYLYHLFQKIGLQAVKKEKVPTAKWEYHGAQFTYQEENGASKTVHLGGYACGYNIKEEKIPLVDGGGGTEEELERLGDIKGKLVLVHIEDIWDGYWINYPNIEANLRGARGVLLSVKYKYIKEDAIVSLSIGSPSDALAMGISLMDARELKTLIHKSKEKEIIVCFSGNSEIKVKSYSYNVWGDIPGKSKQVLYMIAHYDGYYHSYFDDAFGVSMITGIASAILASSYQPEKTIRVVAHGAEEWGKVDSDYDWATGAFEQITRLHPEWRMNAFALLNIDGNFPVPRERGFQVKTSMEFYEEIEKWVRQIVKGQNYEFQVLMPTSTMSEEFSYAKQGIPCVVAADSFKESIYYMHIYHSTDDAASFGLDYRTFHLLYVLYGTILYKLDALRIRPMHFETRFSELEKSLRNGMAPQRILALVREVEADAIELSKRISLWNSRANWKGEEVQRNRINDALAELSLQIQKQFLRLDWDSNLVFPNENYQRNKRLLTEAIGELRKKAPNIEAVLKECIEKVDMNQHVLQFSYKTYTYLAERKYYKNKGTWGEGEIPYPNEDLFEVARALTKYKKEEEHGLAKIISRLKEAQQRQEGYYRTIIKQEEEALRDVRREIRRLINEL